MTTSLPIKSVQESILPFIHRPLSRYIHEMGRCGLLIDDMVEPSPPPSIIHEREVSRRGVYSVGPLLICARIL